MSVVLLHLLLLRIHIMSSAPKFLVSALIPQFRVTLINHQTVFSFQSPHKTGHRHFLRYFHQYMHWSGHPSASTFLISNFTAFANFFLSLVFFLHRISFCDSFGKIRFGSCYSSLYTLKGRLCVILFTSCFCAVGRPHLSSNNARGFSACINLH